MSKAAIRIADEIREQGAIPFARFMELALYCPNCGYYETEKDRIGAGGDYYTSVSVGSLFGELLARQFADWFNEGEPGLPGREGRRPGAGKVRIVEAGAHFGKLAGDILTWMRQYCPVLFEQLEYWIVEPSDGRRAWQGQCLAAFGDKVRWAGKLQAAGEVAGSERHNPASVPVPEIIFSNELLDAMPVRRLGWDKNERAWFEWGVTLREKQFVWTRMADGGWGMERSCLQVAFPSPLFQPPLGEDVLVVLPDGFCLELCPAAEGWWREAANRLQQGKLLTIDYGLTADELLMPERKQGTLRAYRRHLPGSDVLACPGEQDITADVNFAAIQAAGESAGLRTDGLFTQAQFLTAIAARTCQAEGSFGEWTPERTRQFQTLTHPEHLGRSFRVLVQSRGSGGQQ